jgi:hypothetical protein
MQYLFHRHHRHMLDFLSMPGPHSQPQMSRQQCYHESRFPALCRRPGLHKLELRKEPQRSKLPPHRFLRSRQRYKNLDRHNPELRKSEETP